MDSSFFDRISDPIAAVTALGRAIARSQLFGCETEAAGEVLAMECLVQKLPPLQLAHRYHMIYGKLSMKADYMLARANELGWRHDIIQRDAEGARCKITHADGRVYEMGLTWEQAQKEPFVYQGKEKDVVPMLLAAQKPKLKDKYATPRSRSQMLWARVISDLIRAAEPRVNHGAYTTEEVADDVEGATGRPGVEVVMPPVVVTQQQTVAKEAVKAASPSPATSAGAVPAENAKLIDDALNLITFLKMPSDKVEAMLKKREVVKWTDLTVPQLQQIVGNLTKAAQGSGPGALSSSAVSIAAKQAEFETTIHGPVAPADVDRIKTLVKELEQSSPGASIRFAERMKSSGMKLAEVSSATAVEMIRTLELKLLDAFFAVSLEKYQPKGAGTPGN